MRSSGDSTGQVCTGVKTDVGRQLLSLDSGSQLSGGFREFLPVVSRELLGVALTLRIS